MKLLCTVPFAVYMIPVCVCVCLCVCVRASVEFTIGMHWSESIWLVGM